MGRNIMINYYHLLQVDPKADFQIIKAAYRALMKKNHPDSGGEDMQAQLINQAYEWLSNPLKRKSYDSLLTNKLNTRIEKPNPSLLIRCPKCNALNRCIQKNNISKWHCGRCQSLLQACQNFNVALNQIRLDVENYLKECFWKKNTENTDFELCMETNFVFKNKIYLKLLKDLSPISLNVFFKKMMKIYGDKNRYFSNNSSYFYIITNQILHKDQLTQQLNRFQKMWPSKIKNLNIIIYSIKNGTTLHLKNPKNMPEDTKHLNLIFNRYISNI